MTINKSFLRKFLPIFFVPCLTLSSGAFATVLTLPGTGFDAVGNPLTSGSVDANWSLSGAFTSSNQSYFIAPGNPDWWPGGGSYGTYIGNTNAATFAGSGWISNNASSYYNGSAPYTFSMKFNLSAFKLNTVSIAGQWAIADGGTLDVNGHLVSSLPGNVGSDWEILHPYSIINTSWLNPGTNTISLTVTNSDNVYEAARFEGGITGTLAPVPEPGEWAMMFGGLSLMGFIAMRRAKAAKAA